MFFLLLMFLKQVITSDVFFYWLNFDSFKMFLLIVSNNDLLIFPTSVFDGLIRRKDKVWGKPSLWSFNVMKASAYCNFSTLSSISNFLAIFLASRLMVLILFLLDFLYVFVMLFSRCSL